MLRGQTSASRHTSASSQTSASRYATAPWQRLPQSILPFAASARLAHLELRQSDPSCFAALQHGPTCAIAQIRHKLCLRWPSGEPRCFTTELPMELWSSTALADKHITRGASICDRACLSKRSFSNLYYSWLACRTPVTGSPYLAGGARVSAWK